MYQNTPKEKTPTAKWRERKLWYKNYIYILYIDFKDCVKCIVVQMKKE